MTKKTLWPDEELPTIGFRGSQKIITKTGAAAHGQKSTKVQVRIPDDLLSQLDRVISTSQIANRSEALRMAVELLISEVLND